MNIFQKGGSGKDQNMLRNCYFAFSYGLYPCVSKHLAYMELCGVIAALTMAFDMELDPKYDSASYLPSIKDAVISSRAYVPVVLNPRGLKA
jgi:cytochrome P450